MKFRLLILPVLLISGITLSVHASDLPKKAGPDTPLTRLDAASQKILDGLDKNQTLQFAKIRDSYGVLHAVQDVEDKIDAASASCSDKNPEFAQAMNKRVDEWKNAIDPIVKAGRDRMETMIKLQDFASPAEAHAYLKKIDAAVAYKSKSMKTIPITDKEQCHKLLETMDDRQEDLITLLTETLDLEKPVVQK